MHIHLHLHTYLSTYDLDLGSTLNLVCLHYPPPPCSHPSSFSLSRYEPATPSVDDLTGADEVPLINPSMHLSRSLHIYISIYYLDLDLSLYLSIYLSISIYAYVSTSISIYI